MEDGGGLWIYIILLIFLIFTNAFFAMSEIAVISFNDNKLKKLATGGDKKARSLLRMLDEPSKFLATIQVGVTISGAFTSAVAADTFADYVVQFFANSSINPSTLRAISFVIITLLMSYVLLIFGELVPKRLAMQDPEKVSYRVTSALSILYTVLKPIVALLSLSTNGILRLIGVDPSQRPEEATEEEIRMMIDVGNESGTIEQSEKDMIHNIFDFDDRVVDEVMTHRTEITAVNIDSSLSEIIDIALREGYSRMPVYYNDIDTIMGVLYIKDLLKLVLGHNTDNFDVKEYMRKTLYIPESTKCNSLFQEFQKTKIQMAVIVDEYGGTSGIVTMEDLIESIVGNIQDEYDDEEEDVTLISDNIYKINGMFALDKIEKIFNVKFAENEDYDYDTISGYIVGSLGRIPTKGEHPVVTVGNIDFKVLNIEEHRITAVEATIKPVENVGEKIED